MAVSGTRSEISDTWSELSHLTILDLIKKDRRPTLILDLNTESKSTLAQLQTVFTNAALYTSPSLLKFTQGNQNLPLANQSKYYRDFVTWARHRNDRNQEYQPDFIHGLTTWTSLILEGRWKVISTIQPVSLPDQDLEDFVLTPLERIQPERQAYGNRKQPSGNATSESFFPTDVDAESSLDSDHSTQKRQSKSNADLLAKIAAFETVAIFVTDIQGNIQFTNSAWHDITGFPRNITNSMGWIDCFEDDEISRILELWTTIISQKTAAKFEARLKRRWAPTSIGSAPADFPVWISAWTYPDLSAEGELLGVSGVMTEISEQKYMETLRSHQLADAIERARLLDKLDVHARDLEMSEERFRRLTQKLPIAMFICDKSGEILYANNQYLEKVQPTGAGMTVRSWLSRVAEENLVEVQGHLRQLTKSLTPITFETRLASCALDDATEEGPALHTWFLVSAYPETDRDGTLQRITGCMTDITDIKTAEEIQATRASDALAAKGSLEHFIDMTSHEIRNPLSATILSAKYIVDSLHDLATNHPASEIIHSAIESAETIVQCSDHSTRIVNDILTVSKLEGRLLAIAPERVRPIALIENTIKMFEGQMKAEGIDYGFRVDSSLTDFKIDEVFLDPSRVTQVLVNLLTNAIKFTRTQSQREISFTLKATKSAPTFADAGINYLSPISHHEAGDEVENIFYIGIAVADTGCGLSEAESKRLFTRFSQANARTYVNYGGSGLGLYISRQLCEIQGGQIGIKSKKGEGSTFAFYVRARRAPNREISPGSRPSSRRKLSGQSNVVLKHKSPQGIQPWQVTAKGPDLEHSLHGGSILLVEDNLINQKVFSKALMKCGYNVQVANHGQEALDMIKDSQLWIEQGSQITNCISIALLDVEMPIMDGLTCIRAIRRLEQDGSIRHHLPVIAITANARSNQILEAQEAGMDDVATKPFKMERLVQLIEQLLQRYPTPCSA